MTNSEPGQDRRWLKHATRALGQLAGAFFPSRCALCDDLGEEPLCSTCASSFTPVTRQWSAEDPLSPLSAHASVFLYEARAAQAVRRLKFDRATALARPMARELARLAEDLDALPAIVVPVPIHWSRRAARGFNQASLLTEFFPASCVQPSALRRIRRTRPQVGLSRIQRLSHLEGAFAADPAVRGRSVLLIDDVLTSGGTGLACAAALRLAGASEVRLIAFASGSDPAEEPEPIPIG